MSAVVGKAENGATHVSRVHVGLLQRLLGGHEMCDMFEHGASSLMNDQNRKAVLMVCNEDHQFEN